MPRTALLALLVVIAGSLAFHAYRAEHPTTSYQSADERSYGKLAVGIADQHTYGNGLKDPLHWPPGAPMLFAAGHAIAPDAASARTFDIPAAYWLQALVSLGTALAAFGIAALLAGAWAGVAAAALVGLYPPLILATGEQLSEPFGAFWLTLAFLLFVVAARRGRVWLFAAGGVALGAAILTRADLLPVPFVLGPLVALWTWRAAGDLRRGLVVGGAILAGAALAIAPWSVYASERAGEFVPVTRGSASALFVGTYLPGNGTTVGMKRSLGAAAKRRNPKLRGRDDFDLEARSVLAVVADRHRDLEFNQAIALEARRNVSRYVREDPVGYARMMLNKVQRMWSRYARGGARHTSPFIRGWHILIVVLAFAGLVLGVARRRSLLLASILAAALTSTAIHMLVVSQARYNLPLMPALLAGGVAGWVMFLRGQGRRDHTGFQVSGRVASADAPDRRRPLLDRRRAAGPRSGGPRGDAAVPDHVEPGERH
jgi:4-amino-4-deoxy-L-arabinose transferase-like glycosyltransferase